MTQEVVEPGTSSLRRPFNLSRLQGSVVFRTHVSKLHLLQRSARYMYGSCGNVNFFRNETASSFVASIKEQQKISSYIGFFFFPFQNVASALLLLLMEDCFSQSSNNFNIFLVLCKEGNLCNILFYLPAISVSCKNPSCSAHNTVLKRVRNSWSSLENHLVTIWIALWTPVMCLF